MNDTKITVFDSQPGLLMASLTYCRGVLEQALSSGDGNAVLLGAGGSTPGPIYTALSETELDWARVTIGLTDERWVPPDHEASNEALMRRTLLQANAIAATLLPMVTDATKPALQEAASINTIYADAARDCDLMIVGMGPDAHTLSWFPNAEGLGAALDPENPQMVCAITARQSAVTGPYTSRITLTCPAVRSARHVLLLITGHEKRTALEKAGPDTPIRHLINAAGNRLTTYWAP